VADNAGKIPQARTNDSKAKQAAGEQLTYPLQRTVLRRPQRRNFASNAMSASAHRLSSRITIFGLALVWTLAPISPGAAHDSWISRGAYRNPVGEWCCGDNDCESPDRVAVTGKGWVVRDTEFVPFEEASPSPDGKVWICRRPDRTRRCVFGPPPGS
jgi:hypothetical protein